MSDRLIADHDRTARKRHYCDACWCWSIQPGDTYRDARIVGDGGLYTWRECEDCQLWIALACEEWGLSEYELYESIDGPFGAVCDWAMSETYCGQNELDQPIYEVRP